MMRPLVGVYMSASSFTSVLLPAPFSPTSAIDRAGGQLEVHVGERVVVGARVRERHVLERDAVRDVGRAPSTSAVRALLAA